jgi:demethylmenaquinone methyltransferase/2-methoxy-6-polyprenyl-1,4-benzoquinol methylase
VRVEPPRIDDERAYYEEIRRVYSSWFASVYDLISFPLRRLRRQVAARAGFERGAYVLDVATGTGAQARAFGAAGATVVGLDLSPRMLAIARRKTRASNVTFIEGDATALPASDASFDGACISFALHEMPATVRPCVIAELARIVRPGGTVIVVDYAPPRGVWTRLASRVFAWFEPESYADFLRTDLRDELARVGVAVRDDRRGLFGIARVVIGARGG